jgi:signal transduction histidine kinase
MLSFRPTTRLRIALWNALGTAGITLATLAAVRQGVHWTIDHEVDTLLEEDVREIVLALSEVVARDFTVLLAELRRKSSGHRQHGWYAILLDEEGQTLWQSEIAPAEPQTADAPVLASTRSERNRRESDRRESNRREIHREVPANVHGVGGIRVGASMEPWLNDMRKIDRLVVLAGLTSVIASPLLGYFLAGRATRDVRLMSATAERLKPANLDERLPLRGTDDEFDRLAHRINELLDRIALYISQRRDFLANSAHELRTPLAAIRSAIEVTLAKPRTASEYCRLLEDVMEEGEALEILVNQILLMSEAQANFPVKDPRYVDLSEVVHRAVDMFRGVAEADQVALQLDIGKQILVPGNRAHLRQVVNNLIDNAIKYGGPGTEVSLTLSASTSKQQAILQVANTGPTIPREDLPLIFDRFFRVDRARSRDGTRGTGLGLSICKTIVESHRGTIFGRSEEGTGTTIQVELPLAPQLADREHAPR